MRTGSPHAATDDSDAKAYCDDSLQLSIGVQHGGQLTELSTGRAGAAADDGDASVERPLEGGTKEDLDMSWEYSDLNTSFIEHLTESDGLIECVYREGRREMHTVIAASCVRPSAQGRRPSEVLREVAPAQCRGQ